MFLIRNLFIPKLERLEIGGNDLVTSRYKFKKPLKSWNCVRSSTAKPVRVAFFFPSSQPTKMHEICNCKRKEGSAKISVNYLNLNSLVQKSWTIGPEVARVEPNIIKFNTRVDWSISSFPYS